jgi:release factor glutamine methyltransferase
MPLPSAAHLIARGAARLAALASPELDAELLFRGVSGATRADLLTRGDAPLDPGIVAEFEAAIARRERHEPIQYILGKAAFWRDEFLVTPAVLIPRPETEILVEAVAARLRSVTSPVILDLGAGSGCIGLSLLRELPEARVLAVDVSDEALAVANRNAHLLGLSSRLELRRSRWFDALGPMEAFDAIVSNPPYVAREDEATLPADVRDFEPALALFSDAADDLSSYRAITAALGRRLNAHGILAFETGFGQADRVAELVSGAGLGSIEILKDLAGIPRVVLGRIG